jgi:hypothetical protein
MYGDRSYAVILNRWELGYASNAISEKSVTRHVAQIPTIAVRRSTAAPPATPAMPFPSAFAKRVEDAFGWAKAVAGRAKCVVASCPRSAGNSPSPWGPITFIRLPKLLLESAP